MGSTVDRDSTIMAALAKRYGERRGNAYVLTVEARDLHNIVPGSTLHLTEYPATASFEIVVKPPTVTVEGVVVGRTGLPAI
jgi:hypothetical protein